MERICLQEVFRHMHCSPRYPAAMQKYKQASALEFRARDSRMCTYKWRVVKKARQGGYSGPGVWGSWPRLGAPNQKCPSHGVAAKLPHPAEEGGSFQLRAQGLYITLKPKP